MLGQIGVTITTLSPGFTSICAASISADTPDPVTTNRSGVSATLVKVTDVPRERLAQRRPSRGSACRTCRRPPAT